MEIRAYIRVEDYEPIIRLLPERSTNAILVQSLAKRWWDTTHTFHIADREMTMTPHDFHRMTGLRCDKALISLKGELSTQLGIDLLRRRYTTKTICYFDIEMDYKPLPQAMADDRAWMARAFLLYLLKAYLFANRGKTISLRWLALFRNFGEAREANRGQACHAYLYSSLDMLNRGTLHQLLGPWKLLKVSSLFFYFVVHVLPILVIIFIHMSFRHKENC